MKVFFSLPLTFPRDFPRPPHFHFVEDEASLSWRFGKYLPATVSDRFARLYLALKLFSLRRNGDWIITGRYGEYFALLQGMLPWGRKPLLLLDVEWYGERKNALVREIKKVMNRIMARGCCRIGVFCQVERRNYSSYFGIDPAKFVWLPYIIDFNRRRSKTSEDDYIFTGGVQQRDYETLYDAVKDLPFKVVIAAPKNSIDLVSPNMALTGIVSKEEYFRLMANSKMVVLSLQPGLRRVPGVITYVAAMSLGKAVIVNELEGSASYIHNGRTGFAVPPKDPRSLEAVIRMLWDDDELRERIANNAYDHATSKLTTDRLLDELNRITGMGH